MFSLFQRKQITRGDITPNIFLAHAPAGAESDLNAAAAAPSQTEVTDLNCSDHSTPRPLQKKWRVASFGESPSDTHSRSDSTIHHGVTAILQPTTIATRKKQDRHREERRKTVREGWDLISTNKGSKSRGGDITPNFFSLIHPLVQSRT